MGREHLRSYSNSEERLQVLNKLMAIWMEKMDGFRRYLGNKRNGLDNLLDKFVSC